MSLAGSELQGLQLDGAVVAATAAMASAAVPISAAYLYGSLNPQMITLGQQPQVGLYVPEAELGYGGSGQGDHMASSRPSSEFLRSAGKVRNTRS